jgi:hypothetical protein
MTTPATPPTANVVFLPWTRQGAAALIQTPDTLGALAGSATLTAAVVVNGSPAASQAVRVLGPSDVTGLSPRDIVRREPQPNARSFESNHFVTIEFDRPDFPWLFTPARAGDNARLRPWLCLVVVRLQDGVTVHAGVNATLPIIEIAAPAVSTDELPDLSESWLWAHSQVTASDNADANALRTTLAGDSSLSLSRLICPRLLEPDTDYIACLVPAFEAGRKAGLGLPVDSSEALQPAWSSDPNTAGTVTLPLYDSWTFRTGDGGDFKSLAQLLHAEPAPQGLGQRPIDISHPGFALPSTFPAGATLGLEGALRAMTAVDAPPWPTGAQQPFQSALADIVNTPATLPSGDPLLAPPLYGRWHAARDAAKLTPPPTWFDELNLDPRYRALAAFGTLVVQEHQEALMASAWQQAGDLQAANRRMQQLQMSVTVGQSLQTRHLDRMDTDALIRVTAPVMGRLRASVTAGEVAPMTVVAQFANAPVPTQAMTPAVRKLTRPSGPLARRVMSAARVSTGVNTGITAVTAGAGAGVTAGVNVGIKSFVSSLNVQISIPVGIFALPHMSTFNTLIAALPSASIRGYQAVTSDTVTSQPGGPQFQLMPEGTRIPMPVAVPIAAGVPQPDNPVGAAFRAAAIAHLQKLNPGRRWPIQPMFRLSPVNFDTVRAQIQAQIQASLTVTALARAVVTTSGGASPAPSATPLNTVMHAPKFPQPMYEPLRDISQDLLLPGLNGVPANAVIGLSTNPRFVDAYLVGLNTEMGHELLWRGYPTDQRGTYFDQFWDTSCAVSPQPDILPIDQWATRALGASTGTAQGRFVMLMRSELLRRYPTATIYAAPAVRVNGQRVPDPNVDNEVHPLFRGSMSPDVTFIGFNLTSTQVAGGPNAGEGYFIVIQQQPTEPQFGLDAGKAPSGHTYLPTASGQPAGIDLRGFQWRQNSAHMAGITRRLPVRIAIHGSKFITK